MREVQERKLQELLADKSEHDRKKKEQAYAVKYHKVRFFERVKIERRISKLERRQSEDPESWTEQDASDLAQAREDLLYVRHFPKGVLVKSLPPRLASFSSGLLRRRQVRLAACAGRRKGSGSAGGAAGPSPEAGGRGRTVGRGG